MANCNNNETIQIEKLQDENFEIWNFQIIIVFKSISAYDVITEKDTHREDKSDKTNN